MTKDTGIWDKLNYGSVNQKNKISVIFSVERKTQLKIAGISNYRSTGDSVPFYINKK